MIEADDLNEIPPHENLLNGEKRLNFCINKQMYTCINDKKNHFHALRQQKDELVKDFSQNNQAMFLKQKLLTAIMIKKMNLNVLNDQITQTNQRLKLNKDDIELVKKRIERRKRSLDIYLDKIEKCKDMVKKSEMALYAKTNNEKENIIKLRIIEYEKQRIEELNKFIFELTEIKQKDEDILQKSTRTALKDARQTIYVNGRWILANDQVMHRIVRSVLPNSDDFYLAVINSIQKDDKLKDESHHLDDIDRQVMTNSPIRNNSNQLFASTISSMSMSTIMPSKLMDRSTILSGLTYTVQFVNLIAFYLNINLPYNLPHSKFNSQSLKDTQFQNAVAKLNTNIVYLSINQHIPVTNLLPKHTLENLHHFLVYFKELRIKLRDRHSISFPNHMIPLLDEMFTESDDDCLLQESIPNLLTFNDSEEWETVPNSNEIPSDDTFSANVPRTVSSSLISSVLSQFWFKNNAQSK